MTTIHPTHTCFDDALDYCGERFKEGAPEAHKLILVHAICLKPEGQPGAGERFAHAWVEQGDECVDHGILDGERVRFTAERAEYYARLRPQDVTRYTMREAALMNIRHHTYGPWEERYSVLCRKSRP